MSAPIEMPARRGARQRGWWTGVAVAAVVLAVALLGLAVTPRSATATASLTVTPRTDAGADAALLLADRYTELAGSPSTLRAARNSEPALADVPLDELEEGTTVQRAEGTAAIRVRVELADRDASVAAANAVVEALVEAGADEDLVDVDRAAEATPARTDTSPDPLRWTVVALLLALAGGITASLLSRRADPTPAAAAQAAPAEVLDDLPGFLDDPPGSPPALPRGATAVPVRPGTRRSPVPMSRRRVVVSTVTAVVVLVTAAVLMAVAVGTSGKAGDDGIGAGPAEATSPAATLTAPTGPAEPGLDATVPTTSAPAASTETMAAALAFESVPLGQDGVAASVTFQGLVLEQRAVGLTVTYPSLSVTSDGARSLAHVRLPTFNCLTPEPPADPVAAGCIRSLIEYADLASPQLQVARDGDRIDLVGLFPTYTRPNGNAPSYTGRAYQLTAAITADGPVGDGRAPAAGVVRIGLDSSPTSAERGVNVFQVTR